MARAIVTDEAVGVAAEQLVADGEEPSIIRVQELVGGGSYSTVKRLSSDAQFFTLMTIRSFPRGWSGRRR